MGCAVLFSCKTNGADGVWASITLDVEVSYKLVSDDGFEALVMDMTEATMPELAIEWACAGSVCIGYVWSDHSAVEVCDAIAVNTCSHL